MRYIAIASLLWIGCSSRGEESSPPRTPPLPPAEQVVDTPDLPASPPVKPQAGRQPTRDLRAEKSRAQLWEGGLIVDVGTADLHKYNRGGWLSGWGRNTVDAGTSVAPIRKRAWIDITLNAPAVELVVRAKGRGTLGLSVGKGAKKSSKLLGEYSLHRFSPKQGFAPGRHRIYLSGRADIDWIWLSEARGQAAPITEKLAGSSSARELRYVLIPDKGESLQIRYHSDRLDASVAVYGQADGQAKASLYESDGSTSQGTHLVDLQGFAGQPMRLELASEGVVWDEISVVREIPARTPAVGVRPKNVIVLLIDTQRADSFSVVSPEGAIGAKGYESLVPTSTTFRRAYNNENWTKPSIATLDTGLYPTTHGARWRTDRCSKDLVFLSEHLQAKGFATGALVSNISAGAKFGFNQGWDTFEKTDNAKLTFARGLSWLDARASDSPFFLYIQTIDPHVPFSVPQGAAEAVFGGAYNGVLGPTFEQSEEDALNEKKLKLSAKDARWLKALYDAESLYHDRYLQEFIAGIRERGILENTLFVILNDHGEEFGEQGRWGHGWTMGDALFRSPLLMHFPAFFPAKIYEEVVEHIDVAPTIVDSLGLPPLPSTHGTSLLPLLHGKASPGRRPYSALLFGRPKKRALVVGDYKWLVQGNGKGRLIHMPSDPSEKGDRSEVSPIALQLCELALGEAIANPVRVDRMKDQSEAISIRPEKIK